VKLSILIPIKNEYPYICELLTELHRLNTNDVEIVVSDNYSDDGTWEYIQDHEGSILVTRPAKPCSPFENHLNALKHASGEYIIPMGGDDIIYSSEIIKILPLLKYNKIVIGQLECFDDKTGTTIEITNTKIDIYQFFNYNIFSLSKYLKYINYDQLIFSFVPRTKQQFLFSLKPNTSESFASWANFFNFQDKHDSEFIFMDQIIFRKRYLKKHAKSGFARDQGYNKTSFTKRTINSLFNAVLFLKITKNINGFIFILFKNRYIQGYYDKNNKHILITKLSSFGPVIMIFIAPIMDIVKPLRKCFIFK
jgi:glycosyltransferase involved in cell wall biosynthesis